MKIYTTDTALLSSNRPTQAWLVLDEDWEPSDALSKIEEQAKQKGADAIVGLRIAPGWREGKSGSSHPKFYAYGTAVKYT